MTKSSAATLGVYTVTSDEGGHDVWVDIGRAIPHVDGRGFDIRLRALPLEARLLLRELLQDQAQEEPRDSLAQQVEAFERDAITRCLMETGGRIGEALVRLKVPRRTLNEKMARLGIDRRQLRMSFRQEQSDKAERVEAAESHEIAAPGSPDLLGHHSISKNVHHD
jgi:Bacterial regulatory protein, Fis family